MLSLERCRSVPILWSSKNAAKRALDTAENAPSKVGVNGIPVYRYNGTGIPVYHYRHRPYRYILAKGHSLHQKLKIELITTSNGRSVLFTGQLLTGSVEISEAVQSGRTMVASRTTFVR